MEFEKLSVDENMKSKVRRETLSCHNTFDVPSTIKVPVVTKQTIDGSVQTLYKGPDRTGSKKSLGYHLLFALEVPASAIDQVHVDIIKKGSVLAVTQFYSPNILKR